MPRTRARLIGRRVLLVNIILAGVTVAWPVAQPSNSHLPRLSRQPQSRSEGLLADVLTEGADRTNRAVAPDGRVRVVAVARPGEEGALVAYAATVGASVSFQDEAIGYFELLAPKRALLALSSHPSVEAFDIDGQTKAESLARGELACSPTYVPSSTRRVAPETAPVTSQTARVLQESGYAALGVDALLREHPTFDGRGVTIAMIDGLTTGVPISHAAFRTATDLGGRPIPKIRDMVIVNPSWRGARATMRIVARGGGEGPDGRERMLPYDGEFQAGAVETPWQKYDFVWDTSARTIWVDFNLNGDFRDEEPLRDARAFPDDIGEFPAAKSPLGIFRVTMEPEQARVLFHMVSPRTSSNHAAMDVGVAAGNDAFIRGVAPGASIVLIDPTDDQLGRISDMVRTLIYLAKRPDVDIISMSFAVATSPVPGDDVVNVVSNRLVRKFHKILITAAGNPTWRDAPDAVGMYSVSVGAYIPGEAARYLGWATDAREHWILPYSARGPRGDGDARPDVVAPAVWVSLGRCDPSVATASYCAALSGGTSAAAPAVAGAVALLVSGAKQHGLRLSGEDVRMLLRASAVQVPGWRVDEQGAGLANIAAAWKLLAAQRDWPTIVGSSSLDEARRGFLSDRGLGRGVYEKGWAVGHAGQMTAKVTRVSGTAGVQQFRLDWTGNDGTFTAPAAVDLKLHEEVPVSLAIRPRASGVHSALLNFRDKPTGNILHQEQVTVSTGVRPNTQSMQGVLASMERLGQNVTVPEETTALRMRILADGALNSAATSPSGWPLSPLGLLLDARRENGVDMVVPQPEAGMWEVSAYPDVNTNGHASVSYAMSLSLLRMGLRNVKEHADGTVTNEIELTDDPRGSWPRDIRGRFGLVTHDVRGEVSVLRQDVQTVNVAPGLRSVVFRTTMPEPARGALSVYVYDCSSASCERANAVRTSSGHAAIRLEAPRPGLWKVIVFSDEIEPVGYRLDVTSEPTQAGALGTVDCQKADADHVRCVTFASPKSRSAALAVLFDVEPVDGTLGRMSCRLAHNRPVPVGLLMELPAFSTQTGAGGR